MKIARVCCVAGVAIWLATTVAWGRAATAEHGMVATVHPLATQAGVQTLREGGNAMDAAVAAALTLGVVDNRNSGIGGGCFILARLADGQLVAVDGRETAPAAATRDMFLRLGKAQPELSQTGPLAVGVPGALAAYELAIDRCGRRSLPELILPAAEIAANGFPLDHAYAKVLGETAGLLARFDGSRSALFGEDGKPLAAGQLLKQSDLAHTYRQIAQYGTQWFYGGPFAETVSQWMAQHEGIVTVADFANYEARTRSPIVSRYRQYTVIGFPSPSSGGIHVAQILNILDHFDLRSGRPRSLGPHARDGRGNEAGLCRPCSLAG